MKKEIFKFKINKFFKIFIIFTLSIIIIFILKIINEKKESFSSITPIMFNCPNNNLKTLLFKIKDKSDKSFSSIKNNISFTNDNLFFIFHYNFTYFGLENLFREKTLEKLGLKKNNQMGIQNLYIIPFEIDKYWKKNITKYIVSQYQKINRFLNYEEYSSKSLLYLNYKKMKDIFPNEYNYMSETYSYPEDKDEINAKFLNYSILNSSIDDLWLLKPKSGMLGKGISIFKNINDINNNYIITKFFNKPHLIRNSKYDIRFHGLITSIKPLTLYFYNEGFVKISSEKYNYSNFNNKFSFITNVGFQKKNTNKYKYPKNAKDIEESNLWNLEILKKYFLNKGLDYNKVYEQVEDIFIKMIFSVRQKLISNIKDNNLKSSNFYHLIGIDILLDNNLKPYLLEANEWCSLHDDNAAEEKYIVNYK